MLRQPLMVSLLCVGLAFAAGPAPGAAPLDALVRIRAAVPAQARTAASLGTEREGNGIVIDGQGHVLTIGYLILEAARIEVTTAGGKAYPARFVGYDHDTGFGLVQTAPPLPGPPIALGDSAAVAVGDAVQVLTAGDLAGIDARVIGRREFVGYWEYLLEDALYVAPVHPDYGGAALVSAKGALIGVGSILTRLELKEVGWIPCNMFVPIDLLKPILAQLIETGERAGPARPWLGLQSEEVQGRVFVIRVARGGPAAAAGLAPGDVILAVNGQAVAGQADFYRKLWSQGTAGVKVPLRVLQQDQVREIVVPSADRRQYLQPAGATIGEPI
jgi:S1-C subfamily serine protease